MWGVPQSCPLHFQMTLSKLPFVKHLLCVSTSYTLNRVLTQAPNERYASGLQTREHGQRKMKRSAQNFMVKKVRARIQILAFGSKPAPCPQSEEAAL